MNDQDLRVVKTRANIKTAFLNMLKKAPVEKISVTELARQAQINKSTFYLHYQDIYELYNEVRNDFLEHMIQSMDYCSLLLSDPEEFLTRFYETMKENGETLEFLWPHHDIVLFQPNLNDRISQKIYEDCSLEKSVRNDMVLYVLIESVFRLSFAYQKDEPELTMDVLLTVIHAFFPEGDPDTSDSPS